MPTIFDVAREAGVSTAAVSLVLNHPNTNRVGAEKRKQILKVARRLGYTPNVLARGLAQRRTHIIGLVVPMRDPIFFNYFIAETLAGIQSCLMEREYHLMVYSHIARSGRLTHRQLLETSMADGIIFFNTRLCTEADMEASIRELDAATTPFVMVNSYYGHSPINYVGVDDRALACRAGEYLAARGHRSLALLLGAHRAPSTAPTREGFADGLRAADVRWTGRRAVCAEYDKTVVDATIDKWLREKRPPTAIFCADDQMAPDVYAALRARGRRIPDDVAVIGRGDLMIARHLTPALTTIRIPTFDMGRRAAELLTDVLDGKPHSPQRILLPTPLAERESA